MTGKRRVKIRQGIRLIWLVFTLILGFFIWQFYSIQKFGESVQPQKSDVIIVLGAQVWGYEPSPSLRERCDWAYKMYEQGYAPKFILSGGHGAGHISEAEAMKRYLMQKGVPEEAMILEERSVSTRTNLEYSKEIMVREGMQTAIIATNRFHQKRAQALARQMEMTTTGYAEDSRALFEPYWVAREVLAILKDAPLQSLSM